MSEHQYLLKRYLSEDGQPRFTSSAPVIGIGGSPFTNTRSLEDQVRSLEEVIQHSPIGFGREAIGEIIEKCFSFFEDANASVQADMERLLPGRNKEKQHRAREEGKAVRDQASAVAMGEVGKE
ncbi:hypothetical protein DL762_001833 [Monosporascus cannonballus]|uniref:Uncharacterized protein n=1 Tax=Monosporascus cannonballus TaxID=155416 RepID=A0ABY0HFR2_9PEZI|nr:hypothetical protein DL763_010525 [Monosporascus cannonballus]RYO92098.1 hypothetical protein DL762_001833 [Monosporascus cannonballus]